MPLKLSLSVVALCCCTLFVNATTVPSPGRITRKEQIQGYRDTVLLAKPKAAERATVDEAEAREHVHIRQRFSHLGDLRVVQIQGGETVHEAVRRLQSTGRYEFVEPDYVMHPDITTPTDPYFTLQWGLSNTGQKPSYTFGADIRATAAWDVIHDAPDIVVALIDSGVRADHQDLVPNLWQNPAPTFGDVHGASFVDGVKSGDITDQNGHGTHVAGIICAAANNGVGTAGVVWRTQLMVLKNAGADGLSLTSDSAACIDYAVAHGAKVINCSWGGFSYSKTLYTAMKAARDAGVIIVCSAGNDGEDNDISPHYPSNFLLDNIISVGNSTPSDTANASSDWGNLVDLFAPGTDIVSLDYATTTGTIAYTGTSMATPHVTGALALLREQFPTDGYRDAINRLLNSTTYKSGFAARAVTNGRLNLQDALAASNEPWNRSIRNLAVITGAQVTIRASNRYSGSPYFAAGDPPHAGNGSNALWWWWIAPTPGTYVVDTSGSEYDTGLDVYTGDLPTGYVQASTALTTLVSNDDDGANKTSRVKFTAAAAGDKFFICTTGVQGGSGYTQLNISLAPANDNFADAKVLTGLSAQDTADNRVATLESGEPAILGQTGTASVWYKWTAPKNGKFQVSAFTYAFDALLAVYTGNAIDHLTLVTADDDTDSGPGVANTDSRCTLDAVAGTTYYIQVETKSATARGVVVTSITDSMWQLSSDGGSFTSAPAVGRDGTVYLGAAFPDHRLYAVGSDGTLKWSYSAGAGMDVTAPAIGADGTIYQGVEDGNVVALKPDGSVLWTRNLGAEDSIRGGIAIASDGTLYLHAADGYFYALDPKDGSTKWRYQIGSVDTYASAAIAADGTIYQGSDGTKTLYALSPDGTLKWWYNLNGNTFSTPAIDADGNVYFASYSNSLVSSLTAAGALRWTLAISNLSGEVSSSPTLSADGKTMYIGAGDKKLHAIDATTGTEKWAYTCGDSIYASTAAVDANGVIYIGAYDGKLYAINADGTLKRTWDTAEPIRSSPVIYGTTLYVGSNDAKLYAFDIGAALANGPWPEFRHDARRLGRITKDVLAITTQPSSQTVKAGTALTLSVVATGEDPLTYQWKKDGTVISGATNAAFTVGSVAASDAGTYTVVITGPQGTVTSTSATVSVVTTSTNVSRLTNVSIRSTAGTGDQSLIVGVTVGGGDGSSTKPLLMRAVGPTLATFGVPGVVQNPVLSVNRLGDPTIIASNDGWHLDAQISAVGKAVGAFDLDPSGTDAALYHSFGPGGYTMQVSGKTGLGVALVEAYDTTPTDLLTSTTPRLINVSARTQVGTVDNVLIMGFAIGGTTTKRLLVRGVGPELAHYGVSGVLIDPLLEIYKSENGHSTYLTGNDNWAATPDMLATNLGFPLTSGSKDAAMIVELQPGLYSAVVKGVNETTGVALVELYELP